MVIGDRLGNTCPVGEASERQAICSFLTDHLASDAKKLAMPLIPRKSPSACRTACLHSGHIVGTY
jgi:hypothetical protein